MARKAAEKKLDGSIRFLVLYGSELTLMREHLADFRAALADAHGEVETVNYDGKSADLATILDELRSYGLMQQYKIILVDEAENFVSTHREALARYAENPVDTASLVLRCGRWYKGKLDKAIEKVGAIVKCDPMKAPAAADWLIARAKSTHNRKLDKTTANLLVTRLGVQLGRLDTELAKLAVMVGEGEPIDKDLIDLVVGRSSDEDAWAVQEAVLKALTTPSRGGQLPGGAVIGSLHELVDLSGQPPVLVTYFIADLFRKLNMAMAMKKQGVADGQIGRAMKLWGPRQALFMNLLRKLSENGVARLFDKIVAADRRAKSGGGNTMRNLEGFCAILADEIR